MRGKQDKESKTVPTQAYLEYAEECAAFDDAVLRRLLSVFCIIGKTRILKNNLNNPAIIGTLRISAKCRPVTLTVSFVFRFNFALRT